MQILDTQLTSTWLLLALGLLVCPAMAAEFAVIAHRGASGYLPEHTLPSKALAYGLGADFLEQDIVLTKDRHPIVLHDIHLDTVTDVADRFPERARADGRYYALDFTLAEIKTLSVHERWDHKTKQPVFAGRFPLGKSTFSIPTLAEEIELVQGLNTSTGRDVGIYPEIKKPAWHRQQGYDISQVVIATLAKYGYVDRSDNLFLQCFDPAELVRIRHELHCQLRLIQLIGKNDWQEAATDYDSLWSIEGLKSISTYAQGVGPAIDQILLGFDERQPRFSGLIDEAHRLDLVVHPYTFRSDALPDGVENPAEGMRLLVASGVDGVFSDFPDVCRALLSKRIDQRK